MYVYLYVYVICTPAKPPRKMDELKKMVQQVETAYETYIHFLKCCNVLALHMHACIDASRFEQLRCSRAMLEDTKVKKPLYCNVMPVGADDENHMCVCIQNGDVHEYTHICTYMYVCAHSYTYTKTHIHMYTHIYIYICVYAHVSLLYVYM